MNDKLKDLLEIYPEWVAYIKFFEGISTKDVGGLNER